MERINVVPMPNCVEFLGGEIMIEPSEAKLCIDSSLGAEEYILTADKNGVAVSGGSEQALFYAKQTLRQLKGKSPCVRINDKPAF